MNTRKQRMPLNTCYKLSTYSIRRCLARDRVGLFILIGGGGVIEFVFAYLTTIAGSGDIVFTLTVA